VDVSASALAISARALSALDTVHIVTHEASYETGLAEVRRARPSGGTLVLFLGSNIGNFDPPGADAFLHGIRAAVSRGDAFLIGADLVKPERELLLAYDDPLGVTAAFNRNLLVRINRELGGDFDIDAFSHRASWNAAASRVEMHLVSGRRQRVRVPDAQLEFDMSAGETIWTESSYKYEPETIVRMLERAAFRPVEQWIDAGDRFALTLVEAV
jgi:L-histidine N-alpha-methyltransferase